MRVTEHLYVYLWADQTENNCNSVFIDGKTPVLIDPGHLNRTGQLFDRMRADGANPDRIEVVIGTHAHPDHVEGVAAFRAGSVKLTLSKQEDQFVEKVGRPELERQGLGLPPYEVDFYLKEGTLILGKHELEVIVTPGHTPGGLSIYWPRQKVLISGDLVFLQGVGRSDLPGGDAKALKESIQRLAKLPVELLVPGHGPAVQGATRVKTNFDYILKLLLVR